MFTSSVRSPLHWPPWLLLLVFVGVAFPIRNVAWFSSPDHRETGDLAANMLQVHEAEARRDLLGPYSRFGFHHPGPVSFYAFAAGDWVFRGLPAPMARAHLTQFLLHLLFLALMAWAASGKEGDPSWAAALVFVGLIAMALGHGSSLLGWCSIWGPRLVVSAVLLCVVAAARSATGDPRALPLAVVAATFAIHNHVLTGATCLPIVAIAAARLLHLRRLDHRTAWTTAALVVLAVAPAILEELHQEPGNLKLMWNFWRDHPQAAHAWSEASRPVIATVAKWVTIPVSLAGKPLDPTSLVSQWIAVWVTAAAAVIGLRARSGIVRWAVAFSIGGLVVGVWVARAVVGPLYGYLFTYLFAFSAILLTSAAWMLARRVTVLARPRGRLILGLASLVTLSALMAARGLPLPPEPSELDVVVQAIVERAPCKAVVLQLDAGTRHHVLWEQQAGLVLELRRRGYWVATAEAWRVMIPPEPDPAPCPSPVVVYLHVDDAPMPGVDTIVSGPLHATFLDHMPQTAGSAEGPPQERDTP